MQTGNSAFFGYVGCQCPKERAIQSLYFVKVENRRNLFPLLLWAWGARGWYNYNIP
jgi:hypothetical protein